MASSTEMHPVSQILRKSLLQNLRKISNQSLQGRCIIINKINVILKIIKSHSCHAPLSFSISSSRFLLDMVSSLFFAGVSSKSPMMVSRQSRYACLLLILWLKATIILELRTSSKGISYYFLQHLKNPGQLVILMNFLSVKNYKTVVMDLQHPIIRKGTGSIRSFSRLDGQKTITVSFQGFSFKEDLNQSVECQVSWRNFQEYDVCFMLLEVVSRVLATLMVDS